MTSRKHVARVLNTPEELVAWVQEIAKKLGK